MRKQKPQNYNLVKWFEIIIYGFAAFTTTQFRAALRISDGLKFEWSYRKLRRLFNSSDFHGRFSRNFSESIQLSEELFGNFL
jgi:hypothetical protein